MPPKPIQLSKSDTALVERAGAHEASDLPGSTCRGRWEPCHGGRKLPRLTLMYFWIAVYCGKYACR